MINIYIIVLPLFYLSSRLLLVPDNKIQTDKNYFKLTYSIVKFIAQKVVKM